MERHVMPVAMSIEQVMAATKEDDELQNTVDNTQSRKWNRQHNLYSVKHELSVTTNGLVLKGTKIVMPDKLRTELNLLNNLKAIVLISLYNTVKTT